MKREDFKKIIKLRSFWKIDKRKGDYELPSGKWLSSYVESLVGGQLALDRLGIRANGDLCFCEGGEWDPVNKEFTNYKLYPVAGNEECDYETQQRRISLLVREIVG